MIPSAAFPATTQLSDPATTAFRGFPPTHRKIETVGMAVFTLESGKIVRASILTDQLGFLQQIGALQ